MAGAQAGCLSQEGEQTMRKRPDYIYKGEASANNTQVVQRIKNEEENKESKATRNKSRALLPK